MEKLGFKNISVWLVLLLLSSPFVVWGQTRPHFYAFNQGEFSDLVGYHEKDYAKKWQTLARKLLKKSTKTGNVVKASLATASKIKLLPSPTEELWAYGGSTFLGKTRVKQYLVDTDYQHLTFSARDPELDQSFFISVQNGTRKDDLPAVYPSRHLSKQQEERILKIVDDEELKKRPATPTPTRTPIHPRKPLLSAESLMLTAVPKPAIFLTMTPVDPTPTMDPSSSTESSSEGPFTWVRDGEVIETFYFPKEKIQILSAKNYGKLAYWPKKEPVNKTFIVMNGKFFDFKRILPKHEYISTLKFSQAFKVMGNIYLVFDLDLGGLDAFVVCRVDGLELTKVSESYGGSDDD